MQNTEEPDDIIRIPKRVECDTSTITDKPDLLSDSMSREKATKSIRPAFLCTSILTIILPILWFIVTGMVSGSGNGYDKLWWVRLLGGDNVGDASHGRGITMLIGFGYTLGLFIMYFYQGNSILRVIYGGEMNFGFKRWTCCASKQKMEPQIVDERKIGILIGGLFCFSNFCLVLCLSVAWPAVRDYDLLNTSIRSINSCALIASCRNSLKTISAGKVYYLRN